MSLHTCRCGWHVITVGIPSNHIWSESGWFVSIYGDSSSRLTVGHSGVGRTVKTQLTLCGCMLLCFVWEYRRYRRLSATFLSFLNVSLSSHLVKLVLCKYIIKKRFLQTCDLAGLGRDRVIAWVQPVHTMNADQRQMAADLRSKLTDEPLDNPTEEQPCIRVTVHWIAQLMLS